MFFRSPSKEEPPMPEAAAPGPVDADIHMDSDAGAAAAAGAGGAGFALAAAAAGEGNVDAYFRMFICFTPSCELYVAPRKNFVYFQSCLQEARPPAQAARFEGRLVQGGQEHLVLGRQPGCAVDARKRCGAATNEQRGERV